MDIQEVEWVGMSKVALAEDRYRWWDFVNAVMDHRVLDCLMICQLLKKDSAPWS